MATMTLWQRRRRGHSSVRDHTPLLPLVNDLVPAGVVGGGGMREGTLLLRGDCLWPLHLWDRPVMLRIRGFAAIGECPV